MDGGIGTDVLCLRSCPLVRPHHIPTRYVRYTVMLEKEEKTAECDSVPTAFTCL